MRKSLATENDYTDHMELLLRIIHHEELRGYVPTEMTTRNLQMPDGTIEECVMVDQVIDILLGILQAHQDGAIRSTELMRIVPRAKAMLPAFLRISRNYDSVLPF